MILFVGTIGILIPGVQPVVLAALLAERHITLTQLGHAASVELLSMGLAAAFAAAFLPPRRLPAIALITSLALAGGNWLTPLATGEMVTAVRALTGFTGGVLIWVVACMIARSAAPDRWAGIYLTVQTLTQLLFVAAMSLWAEPRWGAQGDFALLAFGGLASGAASLLLPRAFVPLPKTGHSAAGGLPPPLGVAGLVVNFLLMMSAFGSTTIPLPARRDCPARCRTRRCRCHWGFRCWAARPPPCSRDDCAGIPRCWFARWWISPWCGF
jgi:hypothetical protein